VVRVFAIRRPLLRIQTGIPTDSVACQELRIKNSKKMIREADHLLLEEADEKISCALLFDEL
jgi:hypothetical protein